MAYGVPTACETHGNTTSLRPLPLCQISPKLINGFECYEGRRYAQNTAVKTSRFCKKFS